MEFAVDRDIVECTTVGIKALSSQDDSPVSITDDAVYSAASKDQVKCSIVFHSPSKDKFTSASSHPGQKFLKSPRRRASTGDNLDSNRSLNRSISIKDATLLALACRGGGYDCEDSPGGVVVDEESRQLIMKGQYFTPQKNKEGRKGNSLAQYAVSEDDRRLLELATKQHLHTPKASGPRGSVKESPFKQLHYNPLTPNRRDRSLSFHSTSAGMSTANLLSHKK